MCLCNTWYHETCDKFKLSRASKFLPNSFAPLLPTREYQDNSCPHELGAQWDPASTGQVVSLPCCKPPDSSSLDEPLKFLFLLICCSSHIPSGRSWAIPSLSWAHHLGCAGGDAAVKGARAGDTQTVEPGHHGQVPKATGACVELEWPEWTPGSQSLVDSSSMKQQWGGKSIFLLARRSV